MATHLTLTRQCERLLPTTKGHPMVSLWRSIRPNTSTALALVSRDRPRDAHWPVRLTQIVGGRRWSLSLVTYLTPHPVATAKAQRASGDPRTRFFAECGDACWESRFHQLQDPACIIAQERDWAGRTGPSFERIHGRPEIVDERDVANAEINRVTAERKRQEGS